LVLSSFVWDPDRVFMTLPYLRYPIYWYGVLFATGFGISYFFLKKVMASFFKKNYENPHDVKQQLDLFMTRSVTWLTLASVLGGRLGYIVFYGWPHYSQHPLDMIKIWEGGLASHGAVIGLLIGMLCLVWSYRHHVPKMTFLFLVDILAIPVGWTGGLIRVGNFFNQEITGIPTSLPWGVEFLHPLDGVGGVVHPVQLYEALFYIALAFCMFGVFRRYRAYLGSGLFTGILLISLFSFRFFIEFLKVPQGEVLSATSFLKMGQLLSLPFICLGCVLLLRSLKRIYRDLRSSS